MAKKWVQIIIGCWLIISPWLLGFSEFIVAKWSNVIFGLIIIILNIWSLVENQK